MQSGDEHIHLLIPAYKAAGTLRIVLQQALELFPAQRICVVDDASGDGTDQVCRDAGVDCLVQNVNQGKGAALARGFAHLLSRGAEWIITMDADGQHSPADLPKFINAIHIMSLHGLIIGARDRKIGVMPLARIFSNTVTSLILSRMTGVDIQDSQCGYRAYNAALLRAITLRYPRFEMESEVILRAAHLKFPIGFINVQTVYATRQSHIAHCVDTFRWVRAVISVQRQLRNNREETNGERT